MPPEDVAKDVVARHVGKQAEAAVLGEQASPVSEFDVDNAKALHAWLEEYLRVLEEADVHLRGLAAERRGE